MTVICIYIGVGQRYIRIHYNARKILQIQKTICNYCKRYVVP